MTLWTTKLMNDFDPNKANKPWATFVPHKSSNFKLHANRGTALNRISTSGEGILYRASPGASGVLWVEIDRRCREDHHGICTGCGVSTIVTALAGRGAIDEGCWAWERDRAGKISDPPISMYLCRNCVKFV